MKIIILGAGRVGASVAENLVGEANDITIVDTAADRLKELQDRLDLRTVVGNAAYPSVLGAAGAEDADMLLAVTQSDEVNMVACKLAASLFNVPTRIARIRSTEYLEKPEIFGADHFSVDHPICPEQIVTDHIMRLIELPEALQVVSFADDKVRLVGLKALRGGKLVGHELADLRTSFTHIDTRVVAIYRQNRAIIPEGNTVIEPNDEVFLIAAKQNLRSIMRELRQLDRPVRRVMIAGGGNIGTRLARALQKEHQVKIIELNKRRCEFLASELHGPLVLNGDVTDEELLEAEGVAEMDVFCALTNDDENNIMSSLLAKRMGARKTICLINRPAYVDLVHGGEIDVALSPSHVTIGSLLAHVRRGDVAVVHSLRRGAAEALELIAHGDASTSKVVGRPIGDIRLPKGVTIGAIVRRLDKPVVERLSDTAAEERSEEVLIAHRDTVVKADDHVIVFTIEKRMIPKIEKLFQVGFSFF
ncbi:MAG TPA: Trk system potassium transporter TrkA [Pelomicrobium sp.]|nr:Trk system potassium transporter TrkA [Pelomicrobium sp.]